MPQHLPPLPSPLSLAVFLSGNGSNLQAIIDAIDAQTLNARIVVVVSDIPQAYGLQRAQEHQLVTRILEKSAYPNRATYDLALAEIVHQYQVDLIVLAGFMRILSPGFVQQFTGKIINIHPSLLPLYPGLHTHERALENQDKEHGLSIHFVTEALDAGPMIAQARCAVLPEDNPETLKQRVQRMEHLAYPQVLQWFADQRLHLKANTVFFDHKPLTQPLSLDYP